MPRTNDFAGDNHIRTPRNGRSSVLGRRRLFLFGESCTYIKHRSLSIQNMFGRQLSRGWFEMRVLQGKTAILISGSAVSENSFARFCFVRVKGDNVATHPVYVVFACGISARSHQSQSCLDYGKRKYGNVSGFSGRKRKIGHGGIEAETSKTCGSLGLILNLCICQCSDSKRDVNPQRV